LQIKKKSLELNGCSIEAYLSNHLDDDKVQLEKKQEEEKGEQETKNQVF
jgi:hypothetical protein